MIALANAHGMPQFFVTYTFGDSDAPFVHLQYVNDLDDSMFCHPSMPPLAQRAKFVEGNPDHVARMYQQHTQALSWASLGGTWNTAV